MSHFVSTTNKPDKKYFRISEILFKDSYRNHIKILDTNTMLIAQNCLNTSGN